MVVGIACVVKSRDKLFPTIGLFNNGKIRVNMGLEPFCFKLENCKTDVFYQNDVEVVLWGKRFPKYLRDYEIDFDDEDPPIKRKKKE